MLRGAFYVPATFNPVSATNQVADSSSTPGGTLGISGWGCAAEILEILTYTRASSAEFFLNF